MPKLTVVWTDHDDCAVADSKTMRTAEVAWCSALDFGEFTLPIANELMVTAFRLLVARDVIPHDSIVFLVNGAEVHLNEYGVISEWPEEWGTSGVWAEEILRNSFERRQRKRQKFLDSVNQ